MFYRECESKDGSEKKRNRLQGQSAKLLGVGDAIGSEFDELITLAVLLEIY
jgi:hypothetical protein